MLLDLLRAPVCCAGIFLKMQESSQTGLQVNASLEMQTCLLKLMQLKLQKNHFSTDLHACRTKENNSFALRSIKLNRT